MPPIVLPQSRRSCNIFVGAIVVGVLMLGAANWAGAYLRTMDTRDANVTACKRAVKDRLGLKVLNSDVAVFAAGAADQHRSEGNHATADIYSGVVRRAEGRVRDISKRLPPNLSCSKAYPKPSFIPLG